MHSIWLDVSSTRRKGCRQKICNSEKVLHFTFELAFMISIRDKAMEHGKGERKINKR